MLKNSSPEIAQNFHCKKCDYVCSKQSDYTKHTLTRKHQLSTFFNDFSTEKVANKYNCKCGKSYKDRSGLWHHTKKCEFQTSTFIDPQIFIDLLKQNQEFKEIIIDQNNKLNEQNDKIIQVLGTGVGNNNTINSHNKTFNLNVFLNEDCKDAMNITDFVDSIKFQLADLEHMGKVGYVEGISNIIIRNLKALDVTKRPVHCTDQKRETIYIKDAGVWTKEDEDNKNVRKLIKKVAFRNSKTLSLFKAKYPDCITSESKYSDTYSKIVIEAMGGGSKCNDYDSENKIIRKIAKEMTIDKNNL